MSTYIYKLKFTTPVRFGRDNKAAGLDSVSYTCHGDTFFSAICNEWVALLGEDSLHSLISESVNGDFLVSDLMPYSAICKEDEIVDVELFLPKPIIYVDRSNKEGNSSVKRYNDDKKKMKNINYIPISKFDEYCRYLREGGVLPIEGKEFCAEEIRTNTAINYREESLPYYTASVRFNENTGIYFILQISDKLKPYFDIVMDSMQETGIGGKRSSGFGKFILFDDEIEIINGDEGVYSSDILLSKMLTEKDTSYMCLSPILPSSEDLQILEKTDNYYQLIMRKGFVFSKNYSKNNVKKRQVAMFNTGSCFEEPIKGRVAEVSKGGNHKVFRYGKGFFVGVRI